MLGPAQAVTERRRYEGQDETQVREPHAFLIAPVVKAIEDRECRELPEVIELMILP